MAPNVFRLHISSTPRTLDPKHIRSSSGQYLLHQVACPLVKIIDNKLLPNTASCYQVTPLKILCDLRPDLTYESGKTLTPQDYVTAFQEFADPQSGGYRHDLLSPLKNYKAVRSGQMPPNQIGVRLTQHPQQIEFLLSHPQGDFILNLANPLLFPYQLKDSPQKASLDFLNIDACGDYKISDWVEAKKITLSPRKQTQNTPKPHIELVVISDDNLALRAFERGQIDFLRRLPTSLIPRYQERPEFYAADLIRLDSLFFVYNSKASKFAKTLAENINYQAWQDLYHSKPRPGCFGAPLSWTGQNAICWEQTKTKNTQTPAGNLTLFYSKLGGVDHDRAMQFLQNEWSTNLGWTIALEPLENKVLLEATQNGTAQFFRRGVTPERPTCLALLEGFESNHPNNFIKMQDPVFDKIINNLKPLAWDATSQTPQAMSLCKAGLQRLIKNRVAIPTGPIYFSLLVNPKWTGWKIDSLNRLDLSGLRLVDDRQ